MLTVLNQVLRTLLHSRLQLGIRQYQDDPHFRGDIILLEPGETDLAFFKMAPLNLWASRSAGAHGYLSVTQSIETHYELIRQILQSYGILMTRREVREGLERLLQTESTDAPDDVLSARRSEAQPARRVGDAAPAQYGSWILRARSARPSVASRGKRLHAAPPRGEGGQSPPLESCCV
jgi:hypothetical protein